MSSFFASRGTLCLKNVLPFYYLKKSGQSQPHVISFGVQHSEETSHRKTIIVPNSPDTVAALPCEVQKVIFSTIIFTELFKK